MQYLVVLTLLFLIFLCDCKVNCNDLSGDNDFLNQFLDLLLNNDSADDFTASSDTDDETEPQPTFANGMWKCGACDALDETKLVYTESNQAHFTNADNSVNFVVNLVLPEFRCVTLSGKEMSALTVRRTSGSCKGSDVAFNIVPHKTQALEFRVKVYGN